VSDQSGRGGRALAGGHRPARSVRAALSLLQARYPHGDPKFLKRFAAARRPGTYLRIVEQGELGVGDEIHVVERPRHRVTIGLFAEAYLGDRSRLVDLLAADALSASWRAWILDRTGNPADG
jgi:MOSC domain-containing protein YiiM